MKLVKWTGKFVSELFPGYPVERRPWLAPDSPLAHHLHRPTEQFWSEMVRNRHAAMQEAPGPHAATAPDARAPRERAPPPAAQA